MAKFHVDFEDISYITDPEMDGDEASAKLIAELNRKGEAEGFFGDGILKLLARGIDLGRFRGAAAANGMVFQHE